MGGEALAGGRRTGSATQLASGEMDWSSSSSSSSDDSDIKKIILDDDDENLVLLHLVDEFEAGPKKKRCRSTVGRLCIPRNTALGDKMLMKDYFAEIKKKAAMRVIVYGVPTDYADEYLCIGEDTTIKSVGVSVKTIIRVLGQSIFDLQTKQGDGRAC